MLSLMFVDPRFEVCDKKSGLTQLNWQLFFFTDWSNDGSMNLSFCLWDCETPTKGSHIFLDLPTEKLSLLRIEGHLELDLTAQDIHLNAVGQWCDIFFEKTMTHKLNFFSGLRKRLVLSGTVRTNRTALAAWWSSYGRKKRWQAKSNTATFRRDSWTKSFTTWHC